MKIVAAGRQMGKTTQAIEWLEEDSQRYMVFPSMSIAKMTYRKFREGYDIHEHQFLTPSGVRGLSGEIGIDNFELFSKEDIKMLPVIDFMTVDDKWLFDRILD